MISGFLISVFRSFFAPSPPPHTTEHPLLILNQLSIQQARFLVNIPFAFLILFLFIFFSSFSLRFKDVFFPYWILFVCHCCCSCCFYQGFLLMFDFYHALYTSLYASVATTTILDIISMILLLLFVFCSFIANILLLVS